MEKKKNHKRLNRPSAVMVAVAAIVAMAGCQHDELAAPAGIPGEGISFTVGSKAAGTATRAAGSGIIPAPVSLGVLTLEGDTPADTLFLHASLREGIEGMPLGEAPKAQTRAAGVTMETFYDAFGVLGYVYEGEWNKGHLPNLAYNEKVSRHTESAGTGYWTSDMRWPDAGNNVRFFAYAPYKEGENGTGIELPAQETSGIPTLTYTVPQEVARQQDLLLAAPEAVASDPGRKEAVPLHFGHALTAVKFVQGAGIQAGSISRITLKGVYGKGTLAWDKISGAETTSWKLDTEIEKQEFSIDLENVPVGGDGTPEEDAVTTEEQTFMMLPQSLPEGASVEVVYTDNLTGTERTLSASITGQSWPMGKTVVYKISTTSIDITPELYVTLADSLESVAYTGGSKTYTVRSYVTVSDKGGTSGTAPVAWTAEFSTNGGQTWSTEQPEWLAEFTAEGAGGDNATSYSATISPQAGHYAHNEALKEEAEVTPNPYNLSNSSGDTQVQNTANCYIVNAPGNYSLPLVYGNAIKNGTTNTSAYTSSATGYNILQTFVNHLGEAITDPYIYQNKGESDANLAPSNATLVWQDEEGLVTNVDLDDENKNLTFTVSKETIKQGNAIVAVRDAQQQIMWSWHIWVTDYKAGQDADADDPMRDKVVTNSEGQKYTFMPVNLGWCDGMTYDRREVKVRFKQVGYDKTAEITLTQAEHNDPGNCTFYQWGRKDPMLGSTGRRGYDTDKPQYHEEESLKFAAENTSSAVPIQTAILSPQKFYYKSEFFYNWCAPIYYNLWSVNNAMSEATSNTAVVKTIYDPSPVGYCVPSSIAFTGFSQNNSPYSNDDFTVNGGWLFYCSQMAGGNHDTSGGTIFFPASSYRQESNGKVRSVGNNGYAWSAIPRSDNSSMYQSYSLFFNKNSVLNDNSSYLSSGLPVRPVQEAAVSASN